MKRYHPLSSLFLLSASPLLLTPASMLMASTQKPSATLNQDASTQTPLPEEVQSPQNPSDLPTTQEENVFYLKTGHLHLEAVGQGQQPPTGSPSGPCCGCQNLLSQILSLQEKTEALETKIAKNPCSVDEFSSLKGKLTTVEVALSSCRQRINEFDALYRDQAIVIGQLEQKTLEAVETSQKQAQGKIESATQQAQDVLQTQFEQWAAASTAAVEKRNDDLNFLLQQLCIIVGVEVSAPRDIIPENSLVARLQDASTELRRLITHLRQDVGEPADLHHHAAFRDMTSLTKYHSLADMLSFLADKFISFQTVLEQKIQELSTQQNQQLADELSQQKQLLAQLQESVSGIQDLLGGLTQSDLEPLKNLESVLQKAIDTYVTSSEFDLKLTIKCQTISQLSVQEFAKSTTSSIEKLQSDMSQLQSAVQANNSSLEKKIQDLSTQLDSSDTSSSSSLPTQIQQLQGNIESHQQTLSQQANSIQALNSSQGEQDQKISQLTETVEALKTSTQDEQQNLSQELSSVSQKLNTLADQVGTAENTNENTKTLQAYVAELNQKIEQLSAKVDGGYSGAPSGGSSASLSSELQQLKAQVQTLSQNMGEFSSSENSQTLTQKLANLEENVTSLSQQVESHKSEAADTDASLTQQIENLKKDLEKTHQFLGTPSQDNNEDNESTPSVSETLEALSSKLEALSQKVGGPLNEDSESQLSLTQQIKDLKEELTRLNNVVGVSDDSSENTEQQPGNSPSLSQTLSLVQNSITEINTTNSDLSQRVQTLESTHSNDVQSLSQQIAALQSLLGTTNSNPDTTSLLEQLSQLQATVSQQASTINEQNSAISSLQSTISTYTGALDSLTSISTAQQTKINELTNIITAQNSRITSLESAMTTLQSNMSTLQLNFEKLYNSIYDDDDGSPSTSK